MSLLKDFKKLDKISRFVLIATFIVIILLAFNITVEILHIRQYQKRVNAGNSRWEQVEDRIQRYEDKIDIFIELTSDR